jgi:hypothetical protein
MLFSWTRKEEPFAVTMQPIVPAAEPTRTEPASWTPDPPNRIRACSPATTSVTRAHAPGRVMSVPSVLPSNRLRRASRSSASTAQHPGSCAIRVIMPKTSNHLVTQSLTAQSRAYPQRYFVKHTFPSYSLFPHLIYNPLLYLLVRSLSVAFLCAVFAPPSLFCNPAFAPMFIHPFNHPWLSLLARLRPTRPRPASAPLSPGPHAPTYRVTSPSPGSRSVLTL